MTSRGFPRNVENFILSYINSVEQLEILLFLKKQEADADHINRQLRTSLTSVETRLNDLIRKNLVFMREENGRRIFSLNPSPKLGEIVDEVAALYQTHRVAIIDLIFSQASNALRSFSDAFRFREKD